MDSATVNERYHAEYSRDFVKRWDDLIGWEGRTAGEADFFPRLLAAHGVRHVADIATGTGFHAVMLAGAGFEVTATAGSANSSDLPKAKAERPAGAHADPTPDHR